MAAIPQPQFPQRSVTPSSLVPPVNLGSTAGGTEQPDQGCSTSQERVSVVGGGKHGEAMRRASQAKKEEEAAGEVAKGIQLAKEAAPQIDSGRRQTVPSGEAGALTQELQAGALAQSRSPRSPRPRDTIS